MLLLVGERDAMSVMVCAVRMNRGLGWRQRMVVAALAAGLSVVGCSGGDEPVEEPLDPGSSPGAIYTGAPLPKPTPVMPTEAREYTLEGAEAVMRYFFEAYNYGFATNDSRPLKKVSLPECVSCKNAMAVMDNNRAGSYSVEGGEITIDAAQAGWISQGKQAVVTVSIVQTAAVVKSPNGATATTSPAQETKMTGRLRLVGSAWMVAGVDVDKNPAK